MATSSKYPGPDFLLIGMPKAGTSWLHWQLARHPNVFLPPVKEIRYFYEKAFLPYQNRVSIFFSKHKHYKKWRFYLKTRPRIYASKVYHGKVKQLIFESIPWDMRFLFCGHTDEWYTRLFPKKKGQITGEISPMYADLTEAWVAHIHHLYPHLKVILFFRNPVERIWSNAKMNLCIHKGRKLEDVPQEEFYRYFRFSIERKTSQLNAYKRWSKYFPEAQLYTDFYDRLCESPADFLQDICRFLQIDFDRIASEEYVSFGQKMGQRMEGNIPAEYKKHLYSEVAGEINQLASLFNSYASRWQQSIPHQTG